MKKCKRLMLIRVVRTQHAFQLMWAAIEAVLRLCQVAFGHNISDWLRSVAMRNGFTRVDSPAHRLRFTGTAGRRLP